jgi:hypothetical protein
MRSAWRPRSALFQEIGRRLDIGVDPFDAM